MIKNKKIVISILCVLICIGLCVAIFMPEKKPVEEVVKETIESIKNDEPKKVTSEDGEKETEKKETKEIIEYKSADNSVDMSDIIWDPSISDGTNENNHSSSSSDEGNNGGQEVVPPVNLKDDIEEDGTKYTPPV